jgi:hypothetical protein
MNRTVLLRRDTAEAWEDANRILRAGEPGYDLTHRSLKVGDGESAWRDLPWLAFPCDTPTTLELVDDLDFSRPWLRMP